MCVGGGYRVKMSKPVRKKVEIIPGRRWSKLHSDILRFQTTFDSSAFPAEGASVDRERSRQVTNSKARFITVLTLAHS